MSTKVLAALTLSLAALSGSAGAAQAQGGFGCPPGDGRQIQITAGDIDCATAADVAAQYNPAGEKYQMIGPFTCYSGTAMTAPLLFSCVADTVDRAEFSVYPG